jgi:mono/diheme cytochrome c family protein
MLPEPEPRARKPAERPTGYGTFGERPDRASFGAATGHIAAIDAENETVTRASMVLTVNDTRCLLPRAAIADPVRQTVLVACLGTDEIDEYDARVTSPSEALVARWKVSSGPTGIALDNYDRLVVWSSFERVLAVVDRDVPDIVTYGSPTREREATPFEVGRKIFHSTNNFRISSDGRACASCHPNGRDDGITWISPDGPRQTPTLAGRLALTAPFGWTGAAETVRDHLRQTLTRLGGRGLNDKETYALLTYLSRMKTPPPTEIGDATKVARGKAIFTSDAAGCSGCHVSSGDRVIGDGEVHDVGSVAKGDLTAMLSTPSLQFVGGTAPYFHDGRYATLRELLRATDGNMGSTGHLNDADLDALTTYLGTL